MKQLILILLISFNATSQLEVNSTSDVKMYSDRTGTSLHQFIIEKDTSYALYFRNVKYQYITDVQYITLDNIEEVHQLLDLCLDVIENKSEYQTSKYILSKYMGSVRVWTDRGYFYMTKKQISKIQEQCK